jgi:hypothetical protein
MPQITKLSSSTPADTTSLQSALEKAAKEMNKLREKQQQSYVTQTNYQFDAQCNNAKAIKSSGVEGTATTKAGIAGMIAGGILLACCSTSLGLSIKKGGALANTELQADEKLTKAVDDLTAKAEREKETLEIGAGIEKAGAPGAPSVGSLAAKGQAAAGASPTVASMSGDLSVTATSAEETSSSEEELGGLDAVSKSKYREKALKELKEKAEEKFGKWTKMADGMGGVTQIANQATSGYISGKGSAEGRAFQSDGTRYDGQSRMLDSAKGMTQALDQSSKGAIDSANSAANYQAQYYDAAKNFRLSIR